MTVPGVVAAVAVLAAAGAAHRATVARRAGRARSRFDRDVPRDATSGGWTLPVIPMPAGVGRRLHAAGLGAGGGVAYAAWAMAVVGAPAAALTVGGPGAAVVAVITVVAGPAVALPFLAERRRARYEQRLPVALEAVARAVRSGASLPQAIAEAGEESVGDVAGDLRRVAQRAGQGASLTEALERWADERPVPAASLAAAALALAAETGGSQARAVDGVAETLRQRAAAVAEVRALSVQARLSGVVIAAAPIVFGVMSGAADPRIGRFLFGTPAGLAVLTVGLGLDAAGAAWMAKLTRVRA